MNKLSKWISPVLIAAAVLNFLLALGVFFFSGQLLKAMSAGGKVIYENDWWLEMVAIGLIVLGMGYFTASYNAVRNSVAVFMGLIANFFGLVFYLVHFGSVLLSSWMSFGIVTAIMGWIAILTYMLYSISKVKRGAPRLAYSYAEPVSKTLNRFRTQKGKNLLQVSNNQPVLLIFLPHLGVSSREVLTEIKKQQTSIEKEGARIVFAYLGKEDEAQEYFERAHLGDEYRISDPKGFMYHAFGLQKAVSIHNGWHTWVRRIHDLLIWPKFSKVLGSFNLRVPGVFLINQGQIVRSYRYSLVTDRPDYASLANLVAA